MTTREQWAIDFCVRHSLNAGNTDLREALAKAFDTIQGDLELGKLADRIAAGRKKYPEGCTLLSLIDEVGEVAHGVNKYELGERIRDELLDVAAVAMRLYFGEIDRGLQLDGLVQVRTDGRPNVRAAAPCAACVAGVPHRHDAP